MAVNTSKIGAQVVEALGLPASKVTSIKLEMRADDVVRVEVEMLPSEKEALGVFDVIKRYKLVEVGEEILMRADGDAVQDVTTMGDEVRRYARIDADVAAAKQKIALMANRAFAKMRVDRLAEALSHCQRYS